MESTIKRAPAPAGWIVHTRRGARLLRRVLEFVFHIALALMAAFAVASWAIPAAYAERGYSAVGGEWLLIVLTFAAVMYFTEANNK